MASIISNSDDLTDVGGLGYGGRRAAVHRPGTTPDKAASHTLPNANEAQAPGALPRGAARPVANAAKGAALGCARAPSQHHTWDRRSTDVPRPRAISAQPKPAEWLHLSQPYGRARPDEPARSHLDAHAKHDRARLERAAGAHRYIQRPRSAPYSREYRPVRPAACFPPTPFVGEPVCTAPPKSVAHTATSIPRWAEHIHNAR